MFRIVVKSNLTMSLAMNLKEQFALTLPILDGMQDGYRSMHSAKQAIQVATASTANLDTTTMTSIATAVKVAQSWTDRRKSAIDKLNGFDLAMLEELAEEAEEEEETANEEKASPKRDFVANRRHRQSLHQVC